MPIYEYKCYNCDYEFEVFQKMSESSISKCPKCEEDKVKRLISNTSFHLKGTGWYKTDYKEGKKVKNTESNSSKADNEKKP